MYKEIDGAVPRIEAMGTMIFDPVWAERVHIDRRCELIHVLAGSVELVIGRRRYRAEPGDTLLVPAGAPHRDAFDFDKGLEVFMVYFAWRSAKAYFRLVSNRVWEGMPRPRRIELLRIIERLRGDIPEGSSADRLVAGARLLTVLTLVLRESLRQKGAAGRDKGRAGDDRRRALMLRAKQFLHQHYAGHVSLDDMAGALAVSPFYLSRVFSQESDFTLFEYLTTLRMGKARELLAGGTKVVAVARSVGYDDDSYFAKVFRRHFGMSPHEARAAAGQ